MRIIFRILVVTVVILIGLADIMRRIEEKKRRGIKLDFLLYYEFLD